MPIAAIVLASVITMCPGVERGGGSNLPGVITSIVLFLASIIFRYRAELEEKNRQTASVVEE